MLFVLLVGSLFLLACQKESFENELFSGNNLSNLSKSKPVKIINGNVKDIDGNKYLTVKIGRQVWMAENLKTTRLNDGTEIQMVTENDKWVDLKTSETPGYCWYNNDKRYGETYGALYNYYTVNTKKLCPKGWHVPSSDEWLVLLGTYTGGALKSTGTIEGGDGLWLAPNFGATNSTGFSGLPGGLRHGSLSQYPTYSGTFAMINGWGDWWSTTLFKGGHHCYILVATTPFAETNYDESESGHSIRCLKN